MAENLSFGEAIIEMLDYAQKNNRKVVVQLIGESKAADLNPSAQLRDGYLHINNFDGSTSLVSLAAIAIVRLEQR